ncbi:MAG TPA: radical SAM protein [Tissierellia bacterium]|nr:radical SAM protein [Tissierellia bacterium]
MNYIGKVYRPPSEARSLILQATVGCSHNKCTFCHMYKDDDFRIRKLPDILADLEEMAKLRYPYKRLFIADGDALVLPTNTLIAIIEKAKEVLPYLERIGIYASPTSIRIKSDEDLKLLKEHGLDIAYLGLESGDDVVLENVCKGSTSQEILRGAQRLKDAGILLSVTLISGLGGKERLKEHALHSAQVLSEMDPDYLGLLTLHIEASTPIYKQVTDGSLTLLSPMEVLEELDILINHLNVTNTIFRSNHASNYWALAGTLPQDKEKLLLEVEKARSGLLESRSEWMRAL